jgi:SpoVK/Ycf46/Vps4 family AAA+-type ATPase
MANGKLLRELIKTGAAGNIEDFRRVTEEVIREERRKQHHLLASELEKILYSRSSSPNVGLRQLANSVPHDRERGIRLLEPHSAKRGLHDVILSEENRQILETILREHHRADLLQSYGLHPTNRFLFCGPPGCGKTLTAEVIATELSWPLVMVRLDSVISSFLGETAANLRQVFDFIQTLPMVVLFDEFDALAKERSEGGDHGELKRVVNAVLQMMDAYKGDSIIIAATNHEAILDSAIWRRFEEVLVFDLPTPEQLNNLLSLKLRGIRRNFSLDTLESAALFKDLSHADVERIIQRAIKIMILSNEEVLDEQHLKQAWGREKARYQRIYHTRRVYLESDAPFGQRNQL